MLRNKIVKQSSLRIFRRVPTDLKVYRGWKATLVTEEQTTPEQGSVQSVGPKYFVHSEENTESGDES